jgi:hypothetical protein
MAASLEPSDALPSDDSVVLALPRNGPLRIAIFTSRQNAWQPLLDADSRISAKFFRPGEYRAKPEADIALLDGFSAPQPPAVPSLWIQPPDIGSPLPVKTLVDNAPITQWNEASVVGAGLRTTEARLSTAEVFHTFEGDVPIASTAQGPVVVARPPVAGRPEMALLGFDPLAPDMKFQVTTPLLFANLLRWLAPETFDVLDFAAARVGATSLVLDKSERAQQLRIRTESGAAVPFSVRNGTLQLFAARPEILSIESPGRQRVLSLTLPDVAENHWQPPTTAASGLPAFVAWRSNSVALWQILAVLGATGLIAEWLFFGRRRKARLIAGARKARSVASKHSDRERELVNQ